MDNFRAIGNKIIGNMIDGFGEQVSDGGVIFIEKDGTEEAIRPRWFLVTHVGPEQKDVVPGQYVLVEQGRWTRGLDVNRNGRKEDYVYRVDENGILGCSNENPMSRK